MPRIPRRLKRDPILDALFEIRFDTDAVAEVVIGKLVSRDTWATSAITRLPNADIPAPIRMQDPTLVAAPILELRPPNSTRVIKIGERVLSYHTTHPYPGWGTFQPEISGTIDFVFGALPAFRATRLGFRYVNGFTQAQHSTSGTSDFNLRIEVANHAVPPPLNLNYSQTHSPRVQTLVRIASGAFTTTPFDLTALVDIDVFTPDGVSVANAAEAKSWIDEAHAVLKNEFFNLFTDQLYTSLEAEG